MRTDLSQERIPEERLAEQWYSLMHSVMGGIQVAYRQISHESNLNQKIMAARLGIKHPEVISRRLSGQGNMTLRTLHELARAMDCRLDVTVTPLASLTPSNRATAAIRPPRLADDKGPTTGEVYEIKRDLKPEMRVD